MASCLQPHSLELEQYFYRPRADLSDQHWAAKVRRAFNFGWLPGTREKELLHRGAVSVHKARRLLPRAACRMAT